MGPADNPESVVDSRLRVYGIESLPVADISIMPTQITGHTNVPAFLIGEKAADMVKEEYARKSISRIVPYIAFGSVDHKILLEKLEGMGFSGIVSSLLKS
ncbi:hypothetical protein Trydic_g2502 [Trypoxylus dichotomus]